MEEEEELVCVDLPPLFLLLPPPFTQAKAQPVFDRRCMHIWKGEGKETPTSTPNYVYHLFSSLLFPSLLHL